MIIYPVQMKADHISRAKGTAQIRTGQKEIHKIAIAFADGQVEYVTGSFGGDEKEWASKTLPLDAVFTPWEKKQLYDARRLYRQGRYGELLRRFGTDKIALIEKRMVNNLKKYPREFQYKGKKTVFVQSRTEPEVAARIASAGVVKR